MEQDFAFIIDPPSEPRVLKVIATISSRLREPLTVEDLASHVGISPRHLRRLLRSYTGTTPVALVKRMRIGIAAELLRTTRLSVKEIGVEVGMPDSSHFVKDFEATYHLSPTQYRKSPLEDPRRHW